MITAPYNFVPLNKEVFYPDWADDVSHDIPFKDGESGEIEITITAKSPIFVRDSKDDTKFCNYKREYFIPGSSVKGMIRNALEIMSFSKMSQFDDNTYAVRDLSNAKNFYMKQMNLIDEPFTQCGWLKKIDNGYVIEDCGIPGRIHHKQIDYAFDTKFSQYFEPKKFNPKDQKQKSAEYKYKKLGKLLPVITVGDKYRSEKNPKYDKREFYKYKKDGTKATLVLTGQPTPRKNSGKMGDGKGFEFLFFEKRGEIAVSKEVFENFQFAYFDGRDTEPKESPDWTFWKNRLQKGEKIPVFFQKAGNQVLHFGLSYLYKLPYRHSIKDGINKEHFKTDLDLVQTIFGYIEGKSALKGRVQFSHFKAVSNAAELPKRTEILGTPRASYYPIYIRQNDTDFKTYMDSNFHIAGWKRYPIHKGSKVEKTTDTGNENVGTAFTPLDKGVIFKGKLRYHNLKKAELGALLSALTFHNTNECFHNIGMAKSLGYGKIELKLDGIENIENYLKAFETEITVQIENWSQSQQIQELLAMAAEQENQGNSCLKYMELPQFAGNKSKTKDYMKQYTQLDGIKKIKVKSFITEQDLQSLKAKQQEQKELRRMEEEEQKLREKHDLEWQSVQKAETIHALQSFLNKYPDTHHAKEIEKRVKEIEEEEARQKKSKFEEINQRAEYAFNEVMKKRGTKGFEKAKKNFVKKWSKEKENKGSQMILEMVKKIEEVN